MRTDGRRTVGMAISLTKRLFTVADYYRMAATGILSPDDRVELLEGEVVEMTPISSRHAGCVNYLGRELQRLIGSRAVVAIQNPVQLSDLSEPQPDLSVLKPRPDLYRESHPRPEDTWLVIEVADTSVETDRTVKGFLYARAGVPEFWLVDLSSATIEVYRNPGEGGWAEGSLARSSERLSPAALPDVGLDVAEVFGETRVPD
ncbi:MAG: Uma2 family endonuclease [Gemmatimonas sp.]|nr:Uma2 family endonuclease [Gemmatimonas sp.]